MLPIRANELREADLGIVAAGAGQLIADSITISDHAFRVEWRGAFLLAFWVQSEPYTPTRRAWCSMLTGHALDDVPRLALARSLLPYWRTLSRAWPYGEVRAWVASSDARAKRFAQYLGFAYDAGPCPGILPDGRDADLYCWRRDRNVGGHGRRRQGSKTGSGGGGEAVGGRPPENGEGEH